MENLLKYSLPRDIFRGKEETVTKLLKKNIAKNHDHYYLVDLKRICMKIGCEFKQRNFTEFEGCLWRNSFTELEPTWLRPF